MSNTIKIPGIRKFYKAMNYKERISIQRRMPVSIHEIMSTPGHPYLDELALEIIYVAARRLNRDEVTHDFLEAMTMDEFDSYSEELLNELGYPADLIEVDDDGVPLVFQDSQQETEKPKKTSKSKSGSSAQESSLTSTTAASSPDGA